MGTASFAMDNAGANPRPVNLLGTGGGLAAQSGATLTVDGVIAGAAGTGPLTIGLPASSASQNTAGLLPGTGGGTANAAVNATGTVLLSGANTYTGNTLIASGTLLVNNAAGSGTGSGAVVVNSGGTLGGNGIISGAVNVCFRRRVCSGQSARRVDHRQQPDAGGGQHDVRASPAFAAHERRGENFRRFQRRRHLDRDQHRRGGVHGGRQLSVVRRGEYAGSLPASFCRR